MDKYLSERVEKQRTWYQDKADENKKTFMSYQTRVIVLGALIPVVVAAGAAFDIPDAYINFITVVLSTAISIFAGLDKLKQPQPNWFNYRANEESIKKEEWFFKYKAGPYRDLPEEDAKLMFVERIESIISADIARMVVGNSENKATAGPVSDKDATSAV